MKAISTVNLTKEYKKLTAVDSLNLEIEEGELFALLGVNGAGKTTSIRMLSCLSSPTRGTALVDGKDVQTDSSSVKSVIGISTQDTAVAANLTVEENLRFMAGITAPSTVAKSEINDRAEKMISLFNMEEVRNKKAKTLSGGWQRKLSIAMALIGDPKILYLDEPTLGLDVLARRELWKLINNLKGRITIVLTTHYMEEAEALADRIGIMIKGRLEAIGTVSELEEMTGKKGLEEVFVSIAEK
ncbi:MAG: ABC transporter A subfamily ATP-binding protein [Lachnospiraceae bacterium]|nr:ABC transporter A subfamily ATP-binding protein [Lachnospiraceae bacterium]